MVSWQKMSGRSESGEGIRVVKIRRTEGQVSLAGREVGSLLEAGVDEVKTAIEEGGQDAIGGSFPSFSLLPM
jgi:hypothetical protein